tara:strand:+ start:1417 stop:1590 length:174 start_codon:yes stop_codon:yes gene_type:complete
MKTIFYIIFIFITVSSYKNKTTNKDNNVVKSLDEELLCQQSGNINNFQKFGIERTCK